MVFRYLDPYLVAYGFGLFLLAAYVYVIGVSDGLKRAERFQSEDIGEDAPPRRWWRR